MSPTSVGSLHLVGTHVGTLGRTLLVICWLSRPLDYHPPSRLYLLCRSAYASGSFDIGSFTASLAWFSHPLMLSAPSDFLDSGGTPPGLFSVLCLCPVPAGLQPVGDHLILHPVILPRSSALVYSDPPRFGSYTGWIGCSDSFVSLPALQGLVGLDSGPYYTLPSAITCLNEREKAAQSPNYLRFVYISTSFLV